MWNKKVGINIPDVKGVLFDVDGTLYHQTPVRICMAILLISSNIHRPMELLRKLSVIIHYRKSQEILRIYNGTLRCCLQEQLMLTAQRTGESFNFVSSVIDEWFERKPLPFIRLFRRKSITSEIERLHKTGMKLGVYSDYPVSDCKLKSLGLQQFISIAVSPKTPEVRGFKPKSNGFLVAADQMGLKPFEILYVGDRRDVDERGALNAGMRCLIVRGFFNKKEV
ncbi:HAD family hydrolase [Candidatus Roizmanbacteria bacterium]|nr:HAD family hydrolase [Candidatus Roizmanbacteria bacterium]